VPIAEKMRIGGLKIRVDRMIYTTITLLTVLIIYDGWEQLRFWNVVTVILGPILAIFLSHVFGAALGSRVAQGRPLTRHEHRTVFAEECRFLLIAVPPLVILVILTIAGVSFTRIIQVIVLTGVLSLGVWGGVGRTAGRGDRMDARAPDRLRPVARGHHLGAPGVAPARASALPSITGSDPAQKDSTPWDSTQL
jgi:hypothetical protein